jgi:hypothetical protein
MYVLFDQFLDNNLTDVRGTSSTVKTQLDEVHKE